MTYDVQRWASPIGEMTEAVKGRYVLTADAEAHEAAAVEQARQDAIRECIAAVEVADLCGQNRCNLDAPNALRNLLNEA